MLKKCKIASIESVSFAILPNPIAIIITMQEDQIESPLAAASGAPTDRPSGEHHVALIPWRSFANVRAPLCHSLPRQVSSDCFHLSALAALCTRGGFGPTRLLKARSQFPKRVLSSSHPPATPSRQIRSAKRVCLKRNPKTLIYWPGPNELSWSTAGVAGTPDLIR
ncbi:Hypothetical predicted protein [Cloeon dipterum]|uniref:Uncharacterized protein n=1 Tax=Cloeon dipterum TaxID=197152 RepID=A0A8S1D2S8_9INSE|nr:Hypothetical predicted protein [Cloeon dipterum]